MNTNASPIHNPKRSIYKYAAIHITPINTYDTYLDTHTKIAADTVRQYEKKDQISPRFWIVLNIIRESNEIQGQARKTCEFQDLNFLYSIFHTFSYYITLGGIPWWPFLVCWIVFLEP